jgi:SAM-dependent methyltransferase
MAATGTTCSPEAFHAAVDRAFHDAEAAEYDIVHDVMWASLPQQFSLLTGDVLSHPGITSRKTLVVADIGCGTGRSAEALLHTELGRRITHIDLIDASSEMLARAARRARRWPVSHAMHGGGYEGLPERQYDLILTCSVLHHIPTLATFLGAVRHRQQPGGLFLHFQDPHAMAFSDPEAVARAAAYKRVSESWIRPRLQRLRPRRVLARLWREMRGRPQYLDAANARLLADGVIARALTPEELWSVTDIHVPGLPFSTGTGISLDRIHEGLHDYSLVSARTYAFFGVEHHGLPAVQKAAEQRLIAARAMNGFNLAAAWQRGDPPASDR